MVSPSARLSHATVVAPQVVEGAVVGDLEEPRTDRRQRFNLGQRGVGPRKSLLHDVFAVRDPSGDARAKTMQIRAHLGDELEETLPRVVQGRDEGIALRHGKSQASSE